MLTSPLSSLGPGTPSLLFGSPHLHHGPSGGRCESYSCLAAPYAPWLYSPPDCLDAQLLLSPPSGPWVSVSSLEGPLGKTLVISLPCFFCTALTAGTDRRLVYLSFTSLQGQLPGSTVLFPAIAQDPAQGPAHSRCSLSCGMHRSDWPSQSFRAA